MLHQEIRSDIAKKTSSNWYSFSPRRIKEHPKKIRRHAYNLWFFCNWHNRFNPYLKVVESYNAICITALQQNTDTYEWAINSASSVAWRIVTYWWNFENVFVSGCPCGGDWGCVYVCVHKNGIIVMANLTKY